MAYRVFTIPRLRRLIPLMGIFPGIPRVLLPLLISAVTVPAFAADLKFETDVAPILQRYCQKCHGDDKRESGFDARRRFTLMTGGDSGPAIAVGKASESLLIELIEDESMPPEGEQRPSAEEIVTLRNWVDAGAKTAAKTEPPLPRSDAAATASFTQQQRDHWAFQPIRSPTVPGLKSTWIGSPIDAFILRGLDRQGWSPSEPATRREWIRRVTFDLTGLPPTPAEIQALLDDRSHDAERRVVDRLLASPRYGERWAQHWLDVVRFAESEGFEYDRHLPDAWRFRDFVIEALNRDLPFDEFIHLQLAGDERDHPTRFEQSAAIFHRLGAVRRNAGNPDIALSRNEVLTERTNIVGEAFLALSVGCARCHNHKLEPITQKDYYRLQSYFAATHEHNVVLADSKRQETWQRESDQINGRIKQLKKQLDSAKGQQKVKLESQIKQLTASLPDHLPTIPAIRNEAEKRTAIHVLRRGIWEQKGVAVAPRPLSVLTSDEVGELPADISKPRTKLAEWIASADNPLTARVVVNRIWQHHFGVGLVATPNDFGTHGAKPSHPELLDYLATRLIQHQWRLKPLHREIVLSAAYRQSSHRIGSPEAVKADPKNQWCSRFQRRRLSAEEIRDAMLSVSGQLSGRAGGPSVMLPVDSALIDLLYKPEQWKVATSPEDHRRRSIYLIAKRNLRLPFMEAFDAPTLQSSCPKRGASTHASQALAMLNGRLVNDVAAVFARRLASETGNDPEQIVQLAFQLTTGSGPLPQQRRLALEFLGSEPLSEFALAMLNQDEFLYVR